MEKAEVEITQLIPNLEPFYKTGETEKLSHIFLLILYRYAYIREIHNRRQLEGFLLFFLETFTGPDFFIPKNHVKEYIIKNEIITKLAEFSALRTENYLLRLLPPDEKNLAKILTLYSPASQAEIDYKSLFLLDKNLASEWYWDFFKYKNYIRPVVLKNFNRHIDFLNVPDTYLEKPDQPSAAFFLSTYINPEKDRLVKQTINRLIKEFSADIKIDNFPDRKKIAIISEFFFKGHAVYKGTYRFIEALAEEFDLYLYHLRKPVEGLIFPDIFKEIYYLPVSPKKLKYSLLRLLQNDYGMVIFPDVGMSAPSVFMANIRFAPVQLSMHGHSVSSYGAEIDYFISGKASEVSGYGQNNYSEKLIEIPGLGLVSDYPELPLKITKRNEEKFIITCSWSLHKIRYEHLLLLKEIAGKSSMPLTFRFFSSIRNFFTEVVEREIKSILDNGDVEVFGSLPYDQYLEKMAESQLALDSFHFGGYNTINDALYLRLPAITLEGKHAYNRFAGALLKKAGLGSLVAGNTAEFTEKTVRLINDASYRKEITLYLKEIKLPALMNIRPETEAFVTTVKELVMEIKP